MLDPHSLLMIRGGVARGSELAAHGCTRKALSGAVHRGEILRVRPGVFAARSAPPDIVAAAAHGGALTCGGALRHHGVWTLDDDEGTHVWLGAGGRVHDHGRCDCVAHFRPGRMRLGAAPVELALVHAYDCHGGEYFFAAFESAWNARLLGAAARSRVRAAIPASARWLVDLARADAQSGIESLVRLRLHLLGIRMESQVWLSGVGRVDFVIEGRIVLEADGRENHESRSRRHHDLHRDAVASRLGYETLRFDYAMIIHDWPTVVEAVLAALARARA
ncbi:very-short-patch-repair endonuclease [Microbacterium resistens]|uniref:Very-short-patch-repair endonuclease n=1 Tax=Microbacterium resistens TaxID=156977 RepID=A0ABU1SCE1_9MICO|nr:DUF559 domain-containing protein [Microbacterium resistens]MDR6867269.1 very-short-patch-repair endonuclease [Microbacterium resistens]